ncbi:DoxX family protein [Crocosphaera sp. Alani8]|uniref:DoxX family protein n=1 Tax=Crocosphaera sp. Alani8 TaxID=3038952 RepID=UPI00313E7ABF
MQTQISNTKFLIYSIWGLRLLLVAIFLYHGLPKAIFWSAAAEKFVGFGLPGFLGPITGIAEVIASVLLLFGRFWRASNLVLLFIIAGAIVTVQLPNFIEDAKKVAGLERDLLILAGHLILLAAYPYGVLNKSNNSQTFSPTKVSSK